MADELTVLASTVASLCSPQLTPHGNNLLHQLTVTSAKRADVVDSLRALTPAYSKLVHCAGLINFADLAGCIKTLTNGLETYLSLTRDPKLDVFSSQADFRTSIIPEFLLRVAMKYVTEKKLPFQVTGQTDIPIEIAFDLKRPGYIVPRLQRVDFAIVRSLKLQADGCTLKGFCVPLFAAESKTYFDKNMIAGVAFSVSAMKTTFPHCMYIGVGEFADFELAADSYASSEIDEIYILRKQKRADFRKSGIAKPLSPELLREIIELMISSIESHRRVHVDLKLRVPHGRLIAGNPDL